MEVDTVVRHWISLTVEEYSATHGELWMEVGRYMRVFYAYDGMVGLRVLEWLQG